MNGRERVAAVLAGELPDRVPLAEFAVDHDTVSRLLGRPTYLRNKAACQIAFWSGRHAEVAASWRQDTIDLHRILPLDMVAFAMASWQVPDPDPDPPIQTAVDTWQDRHGRVWRFTAAADDILCIQDPVAAAKRYSVADFTGPPSPARLWNELSRWVVEGVIDALGSSKYIAGPGGSEVGMVLPGGLARGCELLAEDPEIITAAVAHALAAAEASDGGIPAGQDAVLWGDDFGHKSGTFISPRAFRRHYRPAIERRVQAIHARGLKVLKHCCGNVTALLDDFVDMGYDAYQSIQPTAGMDIAEVKRRIGGRMTLWGGVALEHLISGTPAQVQADVERAMACCKPGGRFILGSSHTIAVGTRPGNFEAMLAAWSRLAAY